MVFAAPILILAYICFLCLSFAIAVVLPAMFVILAVLSLITLVVLAIIWRRLKKKGCFFKEYQTQQLSKEGGYWKVMGMKALHTGMIVLMVLSGICLAVCTIFAAIMYL